MRRALIIVLGTFVVIPFTRSFFIFLATKALRHEDLATNFPVAASLRSAATKLKNWFSPKTVGEQ